MPRIGLCRSSFGSDLGRVGTFRHTPLLECGGAQFAEMRYLWVTVNVLRHWKARRGC